MNSYFENVAVNDALVAEGIAHTERETAQLAALPIYAMTSIAACDTDWAVAATGLTLAEAHATLDKIAYDMPESAVRLSDLCVIIDRPGNAAATRLYRIIATA